MRPRALRAPAATAAIAAAAALPGCGGAAGDGGPTRKAAAAQTSSQTTAAPKAKAKAKPKTNPRLLSSGDVVGLTAISASWQDWLHEAGRFWHVVYRSPAKAAHLGRRPGYAHDAEEEVAKQAAALDDRWLRTHFRPLIAMMRRQTKLMTRIAAAARERNRRLVAAQVDELTALVYAHDRLLRRFNSDVRKRPNGRAVIQTVGAPLR
jgi:hypothetical protein